MLRCSRCAAVGGRLKGASAWHRWAGRNAGAAMWEWEGGNAEFILGDWKNGQEFRPFRQGGCGTGDRVECEKRHYVSLSNIDNFS